MSHPTDVGVSRHYMPPVTHPILHRQWRISAPMHRESDVSNFFCECVNRTRTSMERRCRYDTH